MEVPASAEHPSRVKPVSVWSSCHSDDKSIKKIVVPWSCLLSRERCPKDPLSTLKYTRHGLAPSKRLFGLRAPLTGIFFMSMDPTWRYRIGGSSRLPNSVQAGIWLLWYLQDCPLCSVRVLRAKEALLHLKGIHRCRKTSYFCAKCRTSKPMFMHIMSHH